MKRMAVAVCIGGLIFGAAILAQTQTQGVERELIKMENEWGDAIIKRDAASIDMIRDKILADEYMGISDGLVFTKAQYLELVKSLEDYLSFVMDEWNVHVYGDTAVAMARVTVKMRSAGKETTSQSRFTDVWVKRDGRWQCVAGHNSTVPQK
jgi:ketosteroid isomerase-like protein